MYDEDDLGFNTVTHNTSYQQDTPGSSFSRSPVHIGQDGRKTVRRFFLGTWALLTPKRKYSPGMQENAVANAVANHSQILDTICAALIAFKMAVQNGAYVLDDALSAPARGYLNYPVSCADSNSL